ncbi:MAG: SIR2 family protein [Sedimentisphaerales bacterium]|nr:SIR2 family protein [Sedimentisphaerales bacterium]
MDAFNEIVEEVYKHLECENQNWLFGAGISYESNLPIMAPLTRRVKAKLGTNDLYNAIETDLPEKHHIEHVLSHIGDLVALSERSKNKKVKYGGTDYTKDALLELHKTLVGHIADIMRYGYVEAKGGTAEQIGTIEQPIVTIERHREFVKAFLSLKSNLILRSSIAFFTTNYDTLLEDALILEKQNICDGFTGTAMGFWNPGISFKESNSFNVCKLHGSVDWYNHKEDGIIRSRYGVKYYSDVQNVLIYPQATKYIETQKDPFAVLFSQFRDRLNSNNNNILVTSGYSFGDNHINSEIESAIICPGNQTTLIVFLDNATGNEKLLSWLKDEELSKRIFVATREGIYHRSDEIIKKDGNELDWWTFKGLISFLKGGEV